MSSAKMSAICPGGYELKLIHLSKRCHRHRSAWSMDQGSIRNRSAFHNFVPTVTKFCAMWEGLSLPHGTKFGNCRGEIVDRRVIFILILDPWIKLIRFDKSGARPQCVNVIADGLVPFCDPSHIILPLMFIFSTYEVNEWNTSLLFMYIHL